MQRLREHSRDLTGIHLTRTVVGLSIRDASNHVGAGSAFVVHSPDVGPEFLLLSTRHIIARARAANLAMFCEISIPGSSVHRFDTKLVEIPLDNWILSSEDDLACAPLQAALLPDTHLVRGVHVDHLQYRIVGATPDVSLIGRWGEGPDDQYILSRRGQLTTMERPLVKVQIGDDVASPLRPMYFIDATVSRGMSGGAAFSDVGTAMMGIISGHGFVPPPSTAIAKLPESVQTAALALWEAIGPINSGLVHVVPTDVALAFLRSTILKK